MTSIALRYQDIQETIAQTCSSVGRDPAEVRLVAVSKTVGVPEVAEAVQAGVHNFGENRTSLLQEKYQAFPQETWHFIGRIQTNKVKDFVGVASLVHSVASLHALEAIQKRAAYLGITQAVLIEVNVSGEESKDGITPQELPSLLESASSMKNILVQGLMTMAPRSDEETARQSFRGLRLLRDQLAPQFAASDNIQLHELSMGMSEDYPIAIQEGATILRLGRTLFGGM